MTEHPTRTAVLRAGAGLVITGAAVAGVMLLGNVTVPVLKNEPASAIVDTTQLSSRTLVCSGSLQELGADPAAPGDSVPRGTASVTASGPAPEARPLERARPGDSGSQPTVFESDDEERDLIALAQSQQTSTGAFGGLSAVACAEPASEQWLVGGNTSVGSASTVTVSNPGAVTATVTLGVFAVDGEVPSRASAGLVLPAGSQQTVSLNGYAPDQAALAVRVLSRGAAVTAVLQEARVTGLKSAGLDTVNAQIAPAEELIIPGLRSPRGDGVAAVDGHGHNTTPVTVRVLVPGEEAGEIVVTGLRADGGSAEVATVTGEPGKVQDLVLEDLTEDFLAVRISAAVPVLGAALTVAPSKTGQDFAWQVPATPITGAAGLAVAAGPAPQLSLVAAGDEPATVTLTPWAGGDPIEITVPAGGALRQDIGAGATYRVETDAPVSASVTYGGDALVSGYPVNPAYVQERELRVFPR